MRVLRRSRRSVGDDNVNAETTSIPLLPHMIAKAPLAIVRNTFVAGIMVLGILDFGLRKKIVK